MLPIDHSCSALVHARTQRLFDPCATPAVFPVAAIYAFWEVRVRASQKLGLTPRTINKERSLCGGRRSWAGRGSVHTPDLQRARVTAPHRVCLAFAGVAGGGGGAPEAHELRVQVREAPFPFLTFFCVWGLAPCPFRAVQVAASACLRSAPPS